MDLLGCFYTPHWLGLRMVKEIDLQLALGTDKDHATAYWKHLKFSKE